MSSHGSCRRGFTLVELGVIVAVLVSLGAAMVPAVGSMRGGSMDAQSRMNLLAIGQVSGMYAADHGGRVFSFSWQGGEVYVDPKHGGLREAFDDQGAAAWQVQDYLIRSFADDDRVTYFLEARDRLMHRRFSHLVLAEYMGLAAAGTRSPVFVDPADENLIRWRTDAVAPYVDPLARGELPYGGDRNLIGYDNDEGWDHSSVVLMWPFASSYQVVPAAWQPDFAEHYYYPIEQTPHLFRLQGENDEIVLGERSYFEVRFPQG